MPDASDRTLGEIAENDRRLARDAAHDAEVEQPVAAGRRDHPNPDIAAADELRARDDVRTYQRQAMLADEQAAAAEALEDGQRRLEESARRMGAVEEEARSRGHEVRALAADAGELREQTRQAADQARDLRPPEV